MLEPVALIFKLNNGLVKRSLDGLSDDEVWHRIGGSGNPIAWLLGHLTEARAALLRELAADFDPGWGGIFRRGSALADRSGYPPREAIERGWQATHALMRDAFASAKPEHLAGPARRNVFPGVTTFADEIGGLAFHESYHVGQIGFIRKQLGHSAVAG